MSKMPELEQIALRVAKDADRGQGFDQFLIDYAKALVAALGAQEPVAWGTEDERITLAKNAPTKLGAHWCIPFYATPQLPQREGWQWVPVEHLNTLTQAITEMSHARRNPDWFTKGKQGADNQWFLWEQRGLEAIKAIAAAPKPEDVK